MAKPTEEKRVRFLETVPVLRIFDVVKAKEFYVGFLGFQIDWEHRFEPDLPVYMQVSRGDLVLHLSEHHGDGCPGSVHDRRRRAEPRSLGEEVPLSSAGRAGSAVGLEGDVRRRSVPGPIPLGVRG